jgi:hypothetical protein
MSTYYFRMDWTGFTSKTLWDWMDLLIVPVVLAVGGFLFNRSEKKNDREIAAQKEVTERELAIDNMEENSLQMYLDRITELIRNEDLKEWQDGEYSKKDDPKIIKRIFIGLLARARTMTILPRLNSNRKGSLVQFLHELHLILKTGTVIHLQGADLSKANFQSLDLHDVYFYGTSLELANFNQAYLYGAHLSSAKLSRANFKNSNLELINFHNSDLEGADLEGAVIRGAICIGTKFKNANLKNVDFSIGEFREGNNVTKKTTALDGADFTGADLSGANLTGACLKDANLTGANLTNTIVSKNQLVEVKYLPGGDTPNRL